MTQLRRTTRWTLLVLLLLAAFIPVRVASAQEIVWNEYDTIAALEEQPYPIPCIVAVETGHTFNPYAIGRAGELGVAQLHPRGLLPFFMTGDWYPSAEPAFRDPFDPYQAVTFIRWWGETHAWTFRPWSAARYC